MSASNGMCKSILNMLMALDLSKRVDLSKGSYSNRGVNGGDRDHHFQDQF